MLRCHFVPAWNLAPSNVERALRGVAGPFINMLPALPTASLGTLGAPRAGRLEAVVAADEGLADNLAFAQDSRCKALARLVSCHELCFTARPRPQHPLQWHEEQ